MSNQRVNITGSAARENEKTGGNVKAGQVNLPDAGSAAQAAESEAKAQGDALGGEVRPAYRGTRSLQLSSTLGARLIPAEPPKPDLSQRTAADYLPAHLKAQLIAEGKLRETGELVTPTQTPPAPEPTPAASAADGAEAAEATGVVAQLSRRLRNLFS